MGLLDGKRILITGVLTDASLAFGVAKLAQEEGAEIVLTGAGRGLSLTERTARKLPAEPEVLEFDVTDPAHVDARPGRRRRASGTGSTAPCTPSASPRRCASAARSWTPSGTTSRVAVNISAYSLKALADAVVPLMTDGGSIVGLDFDARVAWPAYDWMGVAKAALESTSRYLARDLGPQGHPGEPGRRRPGARPWPPSRSPASPRSRTCGTSGRPLGWDVSDSPAVAKACVALLSDWFPMTTGEIVHVDGGYHAIGA